MWPDYLIWGYASIKKSTVIHDTECPYWDQLLLNNTNWNSWQSILIAVPRPVKKEGIWSSWSKWSSCSVSCGPRSGVQSRQRTCSAGSTGGELKNRAYVKCHGPDSQLKQCTVETPCEISKPNKTSSRWNVCVREMMLYNGITIMETKCYCMIVKNTSYMYTIRDVKM